jgi:hypothetical protein
MWGAKFESLSQKYEAHRTRQRKRRALMLAAGQQPLILQRMMYFDDEMFAGLFDR